MRVEMRRNDGAGVRERVCDVTDTRNGIVLQVQQIERVPGDCYRLRVWSGCELVTVAVPVCAVVVTYPDSAFPYRVPRIAKKISRGRTRDKRQNKS